MERENYNIFDDYQDDIMEGGRELVHSQNVQYFDLDGIVTSLDFDKNRELKLVLEKSVSLEEEQEVSVPLYNRQQIVVSEMETTAMEVIGITDVVFPPVGAEILTQKYVDRIAWNVGRIRANKHFHYLAYGCREFNEYADEAVIFNTISGHDRKAFLWNGEKLTRICGYPPVELSVAPDGSKTCAYFHALNSKIGCVPLRTTLFERGKSYLVYLDGLPMYLPFTKLAVLKVESGVVMTKENSDMFLYNCEDGVYLFDLVNQIPLRKVTRKPDSRQQINVISNSVMTTDILLDKYPYLEGKGEILDPISLTLVLEIDTTLDTMQILLCESEENDTRKKRMVSHLKQTKLTYTEVYNALAWTGVYVGNMRYFPFYGIHSSDIGRYKGKFYCRWRTSLDGHIVVRGMKRHHLNGTWFTMDPG